MHWNHHFPDRFDYALIGLFALRTLYVVCPPVKLAVRWVWAGIKMLVAVAISPLLVVTFKLSPNRVFLAVFTFLWPHNDIVKKGRGLYLRRFYLTPKIKGRARWFLHFIARDDDDRESHDHPWAYVSRILFSGYIEQVFFPTDQAFRDRFGVPFEFRVFRAGARFSNPATHTHKLILFRKDGDPNGEPIGTWTLIRRSWSDRTWGFWEIDPVDASKDRWTPNDEYVDRGNYQSSWRAA